MKKITVIEEVIRNVGGSSTRNTRTTVTYFLFGFIPVFYSTEEYVSLLPN